MDKEPYNFEQFMGDVKEFLGLLFCCLVGVGLFYYLLRYGADIDSMSSLRFAIAAGGIWALIGYWGVALDIDIQDLFPKSQVKKKKDSDHKNH